MTRLNDAVEARESTGLLSGADLHVHTTHSDGVFSPGEVVRAAAQAGLQAVAITDHDTVSALPVALPEAQRLGIELVAGIELTAEHDGRELHLLGYFLEVENPVLRAVTQRLRSEREARVVAMIEALRGFGLSLELEPIQAVWPRAALGRKHLAEWLVRSKQVPTLREAFDRYLGNEGPAQRPSPRLPWTEALTCIATAGGVSALAHPPRNLRDAVLEQLKTGGLSALEVSWPGQGANRVRQACLRADRLGLIPLAGSDFHAPDHSKRSIGCRRTLPEQLERLRARTHKTRRLEPGRNSRPEASRAGLSPEEDE
jgi:predicted metal-dependent phosphoesterase TrpH